IYINGVLAATMEGWTSDYQNFPVSAAAKAALVRNGHNVIAIHCTNKTGGQYIDAGLSIVSDKKLSIKPE
ncbi:MAG TPA: hypothetical protein VHA52_03145, partial [Candidatus Babeliaceae bacterium]|nr:hypothetical protein [Candidatus Babeliaceae bacterium]